MARCYLGIDWDGNLLGVITTVQWFVEGEISKPPHS